MNELRIELVEGRSTFAPGEELRVRASWRLDPPPESLEARLFWYTQGKGTQDVVLVETQPLLVEAAGARELAFRLPEGPYSFSGRLISLLWAVELVAGPSGESDRVELVLSPASGEILLGGVVAAPGPV